MLKWICLFLLILFGATGLPRADDLLIINSYPPQNKWERGIDQGVIDAIDRSGLNIRIFRDYLTGEKSGVLPAYLNGKPCAVLAVDDRALAFVVAEKLPGVWFFVGVNDALTALESGAQAGVVESLPVLEMYRLITHLHPGTRHVVAVGSKVPDGRFKRLSLVARDAYPQLEVSRRIIRSAKGFKNWARAQVDTVLIVFGTQSLGARYIQNPYRVFAEVRLPSYTFWDAHGIGAGVTGGLIAVARDHGLAVGGKIVSFFKSGEVSGPNIDYYIPPKIVFDPAELARHGILPGQVPAGSVMLGGSQSRSAHSPWLPLGIALFALAGLIVGVDQFLARRGAEIKTRVAAGLSLFTLIGGWLASIFVPIIQAWFAAD